MNEKEKLLMHIMRHVSYPATKKALSEACNNMEDVNGDDKNGLSIIYRKVNTRLP